MFKICFLEHMGTANMIPFIQGSPTDYASSLSTMKGLVDEFRSVFALGVDPRRNRCKTRHSSYSLAKKSTTNFGTVNSFGWNTKRLILIYLK